MKDKVYVVSVARDVPQEEYRQYINPMKTRRYGKLLKRALVNALKCIKESGIANPDAIINGTAMGCLEESEFLLNGLYSDGEDVSMPTHFMQSTHNTIASLIGIYTGSHGYNSTFSHRKISFELSMLDAFLRLRSGIIQTALVCVNDEITDGLQSLLDATSLVSGIASDRSVAVMLVNGDFLESSPSMKPLVEIEDVIITHVRGGEDTAEIKYKKI